MVNFAHKAGGCLKLSDVDSSSTVVQRGQGWLGFAPRMMGYKAQVVASAIALPICRKIEKGGRSTIDFRQLSWPQTATSHVDEQREIRQLLHNFDPPMLISTRRQRRQAFKEKLQQGILRPDDIDVSFESFPYYLSETTKKVLIASTLPNLRCSKFGKYFSSLPTASPRILLSGPAGSEIYQETLAKALAKHFGARLLIVDSLLLPGVQAPPPKDSDSVKEVPRHESVSTHAIGELRLEVLVSLYGSRGDDIDSLSIGELLEVATNICTNVEQVATNESKSLPLIVFLKDIEKVMAGNPNAYSVLKSKLSNLPENVVDNLGGRLHDRSKETSKTMKQVQLSRIFPNKVTMPQDEALLSDWKQQSERDVETLKSQSNIVTIRSVLNRVSVDCPDLESLCIKDLVLTTESVDKVVGWAVSHHLMHCSDALVKDDKLVISTESLKNGLNILQGIQNETKSIKKSLKDVVTGNEFEKKLLADVIPPSDIGVTFDDIGALENVKDTLKELVMLPLQRPELFSKGQLTKPCKGILLFGPPGTGKTMLAKAVATEAGANFINISMSSITSEWFGEGEKYVKAVFSLASKIAPSVVFVDEVDSMLGRRENPGEHEAMRKMKNEFMVNWDAQLRMCADGGANRVYDDMPLLLPHENAVDVRKRYKPDVIKGDMDSIRRDVLEFYASMGTQIINESEDQDTTDLHKCIAYICDSAPNLDKSNLCILVAGALGGRFDHEIGNINVLCRFSNIRITLISDDCLIHLLPRTHRHEIHIQSSVEGPHCGLIPIGMPSGSTTTEGLQWDLAETEMRFGGLISTSNLVKGEKITVQSDADLLWTISIKKM
ncbi:cell division control protein 48 E-like [Pyrus ussuriensis x Pyrus communis]|uniref:thiamine diphosphokinase n=1 Tax=Pyrus ussuriensis x Pyrus communis TaxID=2448454 RepID=A0A5N5G2H4_9ROSA|nr:cell division control protein 48 E-like [Pyrus ussuriensis x Pyrus communis]